MKKIIIAITFVFGLCLTGMGQRSEVKLQSIKYERLLAFIQAFYVDTVNVEKLTESAIIKVLSELDPHSTYISKEELEEENEPLQGKFFGIGIQFTILRDTLMVVSVIPGGPSEKVGLLAGDRIVSVDGENIAGVKLTNADVRKKLKGDKGTVVNIRVLRENEPMDFRIIRDVIPIHSVDAAYMLNKTTGYVKIARFSENTVEEFEEAVKKLKEEGMKDLILDLQGNVGGYMSAAVGISDNLLGGKKMIVYTDGAVSRRSEEYSTDKGVFQDGRVAILVDGNSASASEIVSGAIQDWDRGLIVGRRSFGKGLVQRPFPLTDGSMVRLTTSHYYTPSGRCIQKPYKNKDYSSELYNRYSNGELLNADSIVVDNSLKYHTLVKKRTVYGGGGIIPDVFVPIDTGINYSYFNRLSAKGVIRSFVDNYVDANRTLLNKKYPDFRKFNKDFQVTDEMIHQLVQAGVKAGVPENEKLLTPIIPTVKIQLKALIAQNLWDMNELFIVLNEENKILHEALKALQDGTYEKILN